MGTRGILRHVFSLIGAAALSGCVTIADLGPHMGNIMGPNYSPMTNDVAVMAAPATPEGSGIYCRVTRGAAKYGESWRDFNPVAFRLPMDQRMNIDLTPARGEGLVTFQVWFDGAGQKMLFCPVVDGPPDQKISCASIYALDDDLDLGIKRTFDIPSAVEGGVITCAKIEAALRE